MGKNKNFVKEITPMEEDFARWYTDIIIKNELVDYSPVKGFMGKNTGIRRQKI